MAIFNSYVSLPEGKLFHMSDMSPTSSNIQWRGWQHEEGQGIGGWNASVLAKVPDGWDAAGRNVAMLNRGLGTSKFRRCYHGWMLLWMLSWMLSWMWLDVGVFWVLTLKSFSLDLVWFVIRQWNTVAVSSVTGVLFTYRGLQQRQKE